MCRVSEHLELLIIYKCHHLFFQKHSGNGSSLSLFGSSAGGANGIAGGGSNGTIGGGGGVGGAGGTTTGTGSSLLLISRSDSIGGQSSQRLAHQFSHFASEGSAYEPAMERTA
jgi:hypothetical protein